MKTSYKPVKDSALILNGVDEDSEAGGAYRAVTFVRTRNGGFRLCVGVDSYRFTKKDRLDLVLALSGMEEGAYLRRVR